MAKPITPTSYLSEDGSIIVKSNSYIYSITLDLIYPKEKRYEQACVKYISSHTKLSFKKKQKIDKRDKNKIKVITIEWEAAPEEYIIKNKLQTIKK